jgi:hypothetical protein
VRREERRTLKWAFWGGGVLAAIPVLYLTGIFLFGLSLVPPPTPDTIAAPAHLKDAIWARAEGGRATELRPINPFNMVGYVACNEIGKPELNAQERAEREAGCAKWLPAMRGIEYLGNIYVREHGIERASFRGGAGSMATTLRLSHSFTREQFLNTLAARADFGFGWRGAEAAAQGLFGRTAAALTLAEAALVASRIGDVGTDPWCEPNVTRTRRDYTLGQMRDNGAIDEHAYRAALAEQPSLGPRPSSAAPCPAAP